MSKKNKYKFFFEILECLLAILLVIIIVKLNDKYKFLSFVYDIFNFWEIYRIINTYISNNNYILGYCLNPFEQFVILLLLGIFIYIIIIMLFEANILNLSPIFLFICQLIIRYLVVMFFFSFINPYTKILIGPRGQERLNFIFLCIFCIILVLIIAYISYYFNEKK